MISNALDLGQVMSLYAKNALQFVIFVSVGALSSNTIETRAEVGTLGKRFVVVGVVRVEQSFGLVLYMWLWSFGSHLKAMATDAFEFDLGIGCLVRD